MSEPHSNLARFVIWIGCGGLLLAVLILAFWFPGTLWSGLVTMFTLGLLGVLLLRGLALSPGPGKCSALTGVFFAMVYLLIIFIGYIFSPLWDRLPTSKMLAQCYMATHGEIGEEANALDVAFDSSGNPMLDTGDPDAEREIPIWPQDYEIILGSGLEREYVSFAKTGHFSFALVFALLGIVVGYVWNGEPKERGEQKNAQRKGEQPPRFDDVS